MGMTGSGKSTVSLLISAAISGLPCCFVLAALAPVRQFINRASQSDNVRVGHSIQSCTDAVERADPFQLDGRRIFLFDTPGFDDTDKTESEILKIIVLELENQYVFIWT
jgi:predicted GTPase